MLNSTEILEKGIVTNVTNPKCKQQVGIDCELVGVNGIIGIGSILVDKTNLPAYQEIKPKHSDVMDKKGWFLQPGTYEITLGQGCNIPSDHTLLLRQRSGLLRSGALIHSSIFDPGFSTERMGTFMHVSLPIFIEEGARVCQAYVHPNTEVDGKDLYDGAYQGDKQRKEGAGE